MTSGDRDAPRDARPDLSGALHALVVALCDALPALAALDGRRVLVVPAAAHGTVAASVRGLSDVALRVSLHGVKKSHEIALRPRFFLGATPSSRLATLLHELLHIDPRGGLLDEARHRVRSHDEHERRARALAVAALDALPPTLFMPLGHHGEVLMRAWRVRPVSDTASRAFTARDLFWQPVIVETPRASRTTWG